MTKRTRRARLTKIFKPDVLSEVVLTKGGRRYKLFDFYEFTANDIEEITFECGLKFCAKGHRQNEIVSQALVKLNEIVSWRASYAKKYGKRWTLHAAKTANKTVLGHTINLIESLTKDPDTKYLRNLMYSFSGLEFSYMRQGGIAAGEVVGTSGIVHGRLGFQTIMKALGELKGSLTTLSEYLTTDQAKLIRIASAEAHEHLMQALIPIYKILFEEITSGRMFNNFNPTTKSKSVPCGTTLKFFSAIFERLNCEFSPQAAEKSLKRYKKKEKIGASK